VARLELPATSTRTARCPARASRRQPEGRALGRVPKWQLRSKFCCSQFEWTADAHLHRQNPETWFAASARTWAKDADPEQQANTIAGLHEDYLLWLLDEASEMPTAWCSAAEAALTGGIVTKLCIMGNCTQTRARWYRAFRKRPALFHVTRITGDPTTRSARRASTSRRRARRSPSTGGNSYIVKVNILAEFPDRQPNKLLDARDCEEAMERPCPRARTRTRRRWPASTPRTSATTQHVRSATGPHVLPVKEYRTASTPSRWRTTSSASPRAKWKPERVLHRRQGGPGGAATFDQCRAAGTGGWCAPSTSASKALDPKRFKNKRVEMYFTAAEWVKSGGCLPNDPMLAAELSAPRYFPDQQGRMCLEPKEDIKARLGRSPDRADGFVLTFASPVVAARTRELSDMHRRRKVRREGRSPNDYDPLNRERR
jgi:phage terminase large subunit